MADISLDAVLAKLDLLVQATNAQAAALKAVLPYVQSTAASASAGTAALPSAPVGFLNITLPTGVAAKIPYYGA